MAGVDAVIRMGKADPNRLAIAGWSYGGYMAAWAITQTTQFKASMAGAGLYDLASEFGTEKAPAYDEWYMGTPYDHLDVYMRSSPMTHIKNARTPTLILHGEDDSVDPLGQAQQLYRALKWLGVPTELVVYSKGDHGVQKQRHVLDKYRRTVDWLDRYVKAGSPAPVSTVSPPSSGR
jgi:dipeptidyl aminopeptidase/acylaminoacyl peptidase